MWLTLHFYVCVWVGKGIANSSKELSKYCLFTCVLDKLALWEQWCLDIGKKEKKNYLILVLVAEMENHCCTFEIAANFLRWKKLMYMVFRHTWKKKSLVLVLVAEISVLSQHGFRWDEKPLLYIWSCFRLLAIKEVNDRNFLVQKFLWLTLM